MAIKMQMQIALLHQKKMAFSNNENPVKGTP